jgi:hypothetical protein
MISNYKIMLIDLNRINRQLTLIIAALFILLVVTACQSDAEKQGKAAAKEESPGDQTANAPLHDYSVLVGRWLRPDGGYVIEIQKVDMNGKIEAAYYNPRTINISQALAAQKDGQIHLFIELRDVGYPGATYTLTYDKSNDVLNGLYYQPAAGQTFEVQFVRKE